MRILVLTVLSVIASLALNAQDSSNKSHRYFGARAGISLAHPNFEKGSPPSDLETSWGTGLIVGLYLNVPVSEKLSIQPEYQFRQMNSEISDPKTTLKFSYLSLPLFLKYQITEKISVMAGPQFDLLIKGESESNEETKNITHDTEERSIAASVGATYKIWKTLSIEAHYMHGFNHIGLGQRDAVQEFKFESMQITAAFGF